MGDLPRIFKEFKKLLLPLKCMTAHAKLKNYISLQRKENMHSFQRYCITFWGQILQLVPPGFQQSFIPDMFSFKTKHKKHTNTQKDVLRPILKQGTQTIIFWIHLDENSWKIESKPPVWRHFSSGEGYGSLCAPDLASPPSAQGRLWVCRWRNTLWSTWLCAWPDGPAATGSVDTRRRWVFPYKTFHQEDLVCSSNERTLKLTHQDLLFRLLFMKVKAPSERPG